MGGSRLREPYRHPESGPAFYLGTQLFYLPETYRNLDAEKDVLAIPTGCST